MNGKELDIGARNYKYVVLEDKGDNVCLLLKGFDDYEEAADFFQTQIDLFKKKVFLVRVIADRLKESEVEE